MTVTHHIDKKEKIFYHAACPICGNALFKEKKLIPDFIKAFQTKDIAIIENNLQEYKKSPRLYYSSNCCHLTIEYIVYVDELIKEYYKENNNKVDVKFIDDKPRQIEK